MNKLHVVLLNETWFYKSDSQLKTSLQNMKNEHGIELIRKDRNSRGGSVGVAFDSKNVTLKKLQLNCLKNKPHLEINVHLSPFCSISC